MGAYHASFQDTIFKEGSKRKVNAEKFLRQTAQVEGESPGTQKTSNYPCSALTQVQLLSLRTRV